MESDLAHIIIADFEGENSIIQGFIVVVPE